MKLWFILVLLFAGTALAWDSESSDDEAMWDEDDTNSDSDESDIDFDDMSEEDEVPMPDSGYKPVPEIRPPPDSGSPVTATTSVRFTWPKEYIMKYQRGENSGTTYKVLRHGKRWYGEKKDSSELRIKYVDSTKRCYKRMNQYRDNPTISCTCEPSNGYVADPIYPMLGQRNSNGGRSCKSMGKTTGFCSFFDGYRFSFMATSGEELKCFNMDKYYCYFNVVKWQRSCSASEMDAAVNPVFKNCEGFN